MRESVLRQIAFDDLRLWLLNFKPFSHLAGQFAARRLGLTRARFDNQNLVHRCSSNILTFCALILFRRLIINNKAL